MRGVRGAVLSRAAQHRGRSSARPREGESRRRSLVWFRADLRIADNPALAAARERGDVVGLFVAAPTQWTRHGVGANRRAFVLRTLSALCDSLTALNVPLLIRTAGRFRDHAALVVRVARSVGAGAVFCNAEYPLDETRRDAAAAERCRAAGIEWRRYDGGLIVAPGRVLTGAGAPYTVFTPFKARWLATLDDGQLEPQRAVPKQRPLDVVPDGMPRRLGGAAEDRLAELWPGGERAARTRLAAFVRGGLARYHVDRDRPDLDGTSRLSAYLAVGAISPRQCLAAARAANDGRLASGAAGAVSWINELIWREFYAHVVAAFPAVSRGENFRRDYDRVRWRDAPAEFDAWRAGCTGYPLIDAAMRQLAQTGWMHNRLRMASAMFLTKHLLIDWRHGERHFMDLLVDGDFAANNGGWQWSASTGTDAAPYFRIFNPVAQAKKVDPHGDFVRRWVPELRDVRGPAIFEPWKGSGVAGYSRPIVDHAWARRRALEAFGR
jgi:deoxyribodipyrimidine photo-lyase